LPLAEKALIARIRRAAKKGSRISIGIGDDCAVLPIPPGHEALVTTDFSLEGIHFRRDWHPPESVGHRCLARGLSDIAAMGGIPIAAFLSLALPAMLPQKWVDRFTQGLLRLANANGLTLAGGDTAESPSGILADIVVLGSVPKGAAVLRSGARPGDRIFVTGELGGSAAALRRLMQKPKKRLNPKNFPRHFFPEPRLTLGRILREKKLASAMIDISDGLSTDLAHICEESGVGAELRAEAIPLALIAHLSVPVDLETALHGGEDYELLFTSRSAKNIPPHLASVRVTEIGRIVNGNKIMLVDSSHRACALVSGGWEHFRK
jgi:thiamine-monophosphate kinase